MAREEIPDRMTRSVPLAGGMQDDVPEFLQEFPTLAYVENGRFRKENEVEKTLPEEQLINGNPADAEALSIDAVGDVLVAIGTKIAVEYDGTTWRDFEQEILPNISTSKDVCSSSQAGGGMHYGWAKNTKDEEFYVIAYETRSVTAYEPAPGENSQLADSFHVIVEVFSEGGVLLRKRVIENGKNPQVNTSGDGRVLVHYVEEFLGAIQVLRVYDVLNGTVKSVSDGDTNPIHVAYYAPHFDAINATGSNITFISPGGPVENINGSWNPIRAGFHISGANCYYKVHYGDWTGYPGVIYWVDQATREHNWSYIGDDGLIGPGTQVTQLYPGTVQDDTDQHWPLSAYTHHGEVWLLTGHRDSVADDSFIYLRKYTGTPPVLDPMGVVVIQPNGTIVNATVCSDGGFGAYLAYTRVAGRETDLVDGNPNQISIRYGHLSPLGVFDLEGEIDDHRVTSNNVAHGDASTGIAQMFTCEQFGFFEPYVGYNQAASNVPNTPLPGIKPSTNILVRATTDNVTPLATFDATTSKHTNFAMQEQNIYLGRLQYEDDKLQYCNRQLLQPEDMSIHMRQQDNENDLNRIVWYTGEFRGNLYEVDLNPEKIQTTKYGDSVIINTSMPLWYSGGYLTEMSILEQPEIRYVAMESDPIKMSNYIEPTNESVDQWSMYQVIIGYADSTGNLHRSSPSFPVFTWGTTNTNTEEKTRTIGYTAPITAWGDDKNYFVEVYAASAGVSAPQLAKRVPVNASHTVTFQDLYQIGTPDWNPPRTSEFVYTSGGALAADPWPSFDQAVVTSRRMFAIEGDTLYFSKLFEANIAPEFNGVLTIPFGRGRKLKAIGKIDDKVIVFEKDAIHAVYGNGPDNTGSSTAGDFVVDPLQSTVGCSDPESVIEIPDGLLFYSSGSQEFHLVTRDLEVVDIGKPIQDLSENIDVKTAVLFPKEHEVRWYVTGGPTEEWGPLPDHIISPTPSGIQPRPPRPRYTNILPDDPVLVLNYHYNKWTVLSNRPAISSTIFDDQIYRLNSNWDIFRTCDDWAGSELMKYRLPWLRVQDLQNFGRIRQINMLGKYLSAWKDNGGGFEAGDIKVSCKYDYEGIFGLTHEYRWKSNTELKITDGNRLQIPFHPGKPKCQSIQLTIEEVPTEKVDDGEPDYTTGRGFVLSGLDMLYSLKRGLGSKSLGRSRRK